MYSLPNLRSSKERGAFPRRKPCTSTFCTSLRYALSEAFSSSSQDNSTSRTASLVGNFSTETFTFPPTGKQCNSSSYSPRDGGCPRHFLHYRPLEAAGKIIRYQIILKGTTGKPLTT